MASARAAAKTASVQANENDHAMCVPIATPYAFGADELTSLRLGEDEARNHEVRCVPMGRCDARDARAMRRRGVCDAACER